MAAERRIVSRRAVVVTLLLVVLVAVLLPYLAGRSRLEVGAEGVGASRIVPRNTRTNPLTYSWVPGGEIYVVLSLSNTGPLPVKVLGLVPDSLGPTGYHVDHLLLGDGANTDPLRSQPFSPFTLGPGSDRGVLIVFRANPDCSLFPPAGTTGGSATYKAVQLHESVLGVPRDRWVPFVNAFQVPQPTQADCT